MDQISMFISYWDKHAPYIHDLMSLRGSGMFTISCIINMVKENVYGVSSIIVNKKKTPIATCAKPLDAFVISSCSDYVLVNSVD